MQNSLTQALSLIVFDFDGVFTDNKVYVDQHGNESVCCSRADGLGIAMLKEMNIPMFILSTEENPVVSARAAKLKIEVYQACRDKRQFLQDYCVAKHIEPSQVLYVGNDINDLQAMTLVGIPVCPSDSHPDIINIAKIILKAPGGHGAVRELAEILLRERRS